MSTKKIILLELIFIIFEMISLIVL